MCRMRFLLLAVLVVAMMISSKMSHITAFMTSNGVEVGMVDIKHKCPIDNSSSSCYNIGVKSGQSAGQEMKDSHLSYSLVGGVGGQHSPNFSLGYLIGYNRGFNMRISTNDILRVANKTGFEDGGNGKSE